MISVPKFTQSGQQSIAVRIRKAPAPAKWLVGFLAALLLGSSLLFGVYYVKQAQELSSQAKTPIKKESPSKTKREPTEVLVKFRGPSFQLPGEGSISNKSGRLIVNLEKQPDASLPIPLQFIKKTNRFRTIERVIPASKLEKEQVGSLDGIFKFTLIDPTKMSDALTSLYLLPEVEFAEPNYIFSATLEPNDPFYLDQYPNVTQGRDPNWNPPFDYQWNLKIINARVGWDQTVGDQDIITAVIDTGVDCSLVELTKVCLPGYDFISTDTDPMDDNGHGTHVAGTIAELGNNAIGGAGLAWGSKILPIKALDQAGGGTLDQIYQAILFAVNNNADVINMSLGYGPAPVIASTLKLALDEAQAQGVVVVASAGNSNIDLSQGFWPASYPTVISVGATDHQDVKASYSNFGNSLTLSAPGGGGAEQDGNNYLGRNILSLRSNNNGAPVNMGGAASVVSNDYLRARGTSMAAPHVTGLAALILSNNPNLIGQPELVRNVLANGSDDLGVPGFDSLYGFGRINVGKSLQEMDTTPLPIANLLSPIANSMVNPNNGVAFSGSATAPNFIKYTVTAHPANNPTDVQTLFESSQPVTNGVLGNWQAQVSSGDYSVELKVFYGENLTRSAFTTLTVDPALKAGWPQNVGDRVYRSPSVADLNRDGKKEIVAGTVAGDVFIFNANGTPFAPWQTKHFENSSITDQISLGNLDEDSDLELLVGWSEMATGIRRLAAYNYDGSLVPGAWPFEHPNYVLAGVTLKDLDADGIAEVVFPLYYPSQLMVLRSNASVFPGWPQPLDSYIYYGNAAVGDLDPGADNGQEIAYLSQSHLTIFKHDGQRLSTTQLAASDFYGSMATPMIGGINNDGVNEVLFPERTLAGPVQLSAVSSNGQRLTDGFPINTEYIPYHEIATYSLPTFVNADEDGQLEILMGNKLYDNGQVSAVFPLNYPLPMATLVAADVDSNGQQEFFTQGWLDIPQLLYGWNSTGVVLPGYPKKLLSASVGQYALVQPNTPVVTDLDTTAPRKSELIAGSGSSIFIFDASGTADQGDAEVAYLHSTVNNARNYLPEGKQFISYGLDTYPAASWSQAESFLDRLTAGGSVLASVNDWVNGGWSGHVKEFPFNNFALQPGKGYLVEFGRQLEPHFDAILSGGANIPSLTYSFVPGWNFISIPSNLIASVPKMGPQLTAEELCTALWNQDVTVGEIDVYVSDAGGSSGWQGHQCGASENNFEVISKTGYMVLVGESGTFELPIESNDAESDMGNGSNVPQIPKIAPPPLPY